MKAHILHFVMVAMLFLFLVNTLNAVQPTIYPTQDRITYYAKPSFYLTGSIQNDLLLTALVGLLFFVLAAITKQKITILVTTLSVPTAILASIFLPTIMAAYLSMIIVPVVLALIYVKSKVDKVPFISPVSLIWIFSVSWIAVEVTSLVYSISLSTPREAGTLSLSSYEVLFYGISVLKAPLALVFIFSFLIRNFRTIWPWKLMSCDFPSKHLLSTKVSVSIIAASVVMSLLLMHVPYSTAINPEEKYVSVDEHDYLQRLEGLDTQQNSGGDITREIFVKNGERPFFVLLLYGLKVLFPDLTNLQILRLVPYIIWPAFLASIFYVTSRLTLNRDVAVLAVLFTSISSQSLIMVYGGFFANFMALPIAYFLLLQIYRIWKTGPSLLNVTITIAVTSALLFTHVYTWTWLIGVSMVFVILSVIKERTNPDTLRKIIAISLVIIASIAIDYVKITQLGAVGGLERDLAIAAENISDNNFLLRWNNLTYGFNTYLGGFITSIVFLVIAIIWTLRFNHSTVFDRIILSTIYILAFIFLFGDYVLQTRMFLNIPMGIIISIVVYFLLFKPKPVDVRHTWRPESVLLAFAIIAFGIHYLYLSFSNLILPS